MAAVPRRSLTAALLALLLPISGCATIRAPQTTRPGTIDPLAEAVLGAGWLETPLALDNDLLVPVQAEALGVVRACGDRLEAQSEVADAERKGPVKSSVSLLVTGLAFGAATGLLTLAPEGQARDVAIAAVNVTSTTVLGVAAAASIASAVSADGSAGRRVGEINVALDAFAEDWQQVLSDSSWSCEATPTASSSSSEFRAPYSQLGPDLGPGRQCINRPVRGASGAWWERLTAWEHYGAELNAARCLLPRLEQVELQRALRERIGRLRERCLDPTDRVPAPEPVEGACP